MHIKESLNFDLVQISFFFSIPVLHKTTTLKYKKNGLLKQASLLKILK